jgi:hypothetical protein
MIWSLSEQFSCRAFDYTDFLTFFVFNFSVFIEQSWLLFFKDQLFDCLLLLSNFSAIWQLSDHYRWQGCKFRPNKLLLALEVFRSYGSFTCHTYCDTEPLFLQWGHIWKTSDSHLYRIYSFFFAYYKFCENTSKYCYLFA